MKYFLSLLFGTSFLFCMEPPIVIIGQELPKEKINSLKQLTSDQKITAGTLVVIKNGKYKVVRFDKECTLGYYQVITKLEPRCGVVVKTKDIFLLKEEKTS